MDVFTDEPYRGNPLAVVVEAVDLTTAQMQQFANWTNLSETTFLLPPTHPDADYRVRIFTGSEEFPFAGHPTLGSAQAWLDAGGVPKQDGVLVQECGAGLVRVKRDGGRLAFAAPPLTRSGPVAEADMAQIADGLRAAPPGAAGRLLAGQRPRVDRCAAGVRRAGTGHQAGLHGTG